MLFGQQKKKKQEVDIEDGGNNKGEESAKKVKRFTLNARGIGFSNSFCNSITHRLAFQFKSTFFVLLKKTVLLALNE